MSLATSSAFAADLPVNGSTGLDSTDRRSGISSEVAIQETAEEQIAVNLVGVQEEYATRKEIAPISVVVSNAASAAKVKVSVKGLPSGLKFTAKEIYEKVSKTNIAYAANTIYGTPRRSGVYTVTITAKTANKTTAMTKAILTVMDRDKGESLLRIDYDGDKGTVKGEGIYTHGKKVLLRAYPKKGYVFAGWYDDDEDELENQRDEDYRSPMFHYTATGRDTVLVADFVSAEKDEPIRLYANGLKVTEDAEDCVFQTNGGKLEVRLGVSSKSLPKVTVFRLPSGFKFDSKKNVIAGSATKPGEYTVSVKVRNSTVKRALERKFMIKVDNLDAANDYLVLTDSEGKESELLNGRGEKYVVRMGVAENGLPVLNLKYDGDRLTLKGLPAGLKYDAQTGEIKGSAKKAGTYTVWATVKSDWDTYVSTFDVEVLPIPGWAQGEFIGSGCRDDAKDSLNGVVKISTSGRIAGNLTYDAGEGRLMKASFSESTLTGYDAKKDEYYSDLEVTFKGRGLEDVKKSFRLYVAPAAYGKDEDGLTVGEIRAEDEGFELDFQQNIWKLKAFDDKPVFAERKTVIEREFKIESEDGTEVATTLTLTLHSSGKVDAVLAENEVKASAKSTLVVTRHNVGANENCYEADIPLVLGKTAVMAVKVKLHVADDGEIHAEDGEIIYATGLVDETAPAAPLYCVIDLSAGPNAVTYPVAYLDSEPEGGFNTEEYKTTKLVLKYIPAGTFIMGEDQTKESHRVTLTKPFYMALFETTQKQWDKVMYYNGSSFKNPTSPVECVTYSKIRGSFLGNEWPESNAVDSSSFLGKLRQKTGMDFDLPTEAQWEYACRAGTTTVYSYGNDLDGDYMWYGFNSNTRTHEVGTKKPNPWGLYDMHGNVWEWCLDWSNELTYGTDPKGTSIEKEYRVQRGGAWFYDAKFCTSFRRGRGSYGANYTGFRLVVPVAG